MRLYQFMIVKILLLLCITSSFASHSNKIIMNSIPFENITLNPNNSVTANYSFGSHALIFCFEHNLQTIGDINWSYNGQRPSHSLPVSLITRGEFDGQFADANGSVTITNTSNKPFAVSCQFGF